MASPQLDSPRPRLFVGSSKGGLHVAETLRAELDGAADVAAWSEGESAPSARSFDAAVFVLCARPGPDVLLRLGVFLGVLGRERIAVCPASGAVVMPAELRDLAVAPDPAAIRALLRRLAVTSSTPGSTSPVAPRRRRSLGTARSIDPEQTLRIADLSLTGALLETFGEFPEYQRLDLELALGNGGRVRLRAEVVRIQHPQWGRVGGIGVRFLQFEDGSRAILERFLDAERERDTATA